MIKLNHRRSRNLLREFIDFIIYNDRMSLCNAPGSETLPPCFPSFPGKVASTIACVEMLGRLVYSRVTSTKYNVTDPAEHVRYTYGTGGEAQPFTI